MNISKTMVLPMAFIATLGFFGIMRTVQAVPSHNPVAIASGHSKVVIGAYKETNDGPNDADSKHEDGDKEINDAQAVSKPVTRPYAPSHAASTVKNQAEEAHDTPNDADSKHEDAH
jgi:hypothetical protein